MTTDLDGADQRLPLQPGEPIDDQYVDGLRSEEEAESPDSSAAAMLRDKYRGAIVGAAIGDALGSVYEGTPRLVLEEIQYLLTEPHDLRYTDDTAMTIAMADSLIARGAFDLDHMAETFASAYFADPGRGYGGGPPWIFEQMMSGKMRARTHRRLTVAQARCAGRVPPDGPRDRPVRRARLRSDGGGAAPHLLSVTHRARRSRTSSLVRRISRLSAPLRPELRG
jgi:ADP-ribosylglycohydrolase